jgi:hypothetical protein
VLQNESGIEEINFSIHYNGNMKNTRMGEGAVMM